jgi:hypothetical protein
MQTFLPLPDFEASAKVLDNKRLGKQRVETFQILKALLSEYEGTKYGWKNHPATRMWKGHALSLTNYGIVVCVEWKTRGFNDTCSQKISDLRLVLLKYESDFSPPKWLGNTAFHDSHQSNLLRKFPAHYSQYGWAVDSSLNYVWPTP